MTDLDASLSVPRLMASLLTTFDDLDQVETGGIVAGAIDYDGKQAGAISVTQYGVAENNVEVPYTKARVKIVAYGTGQATVDDIASTLYDHLNPNGELYKGRITVQQSNNLKHYLIHYTKIMVGPTPAKSEGRPYWESTMFVEAMIGRQSLDD